MGGRNLKSKTVDIHGYTRDEAKRFLERELRFAPPGTEKLIIIHGSNNGTALRDLVRKNLRSSRILEIIPTFANDGETVIYLKPESNF